MSQVDRKIHEEDIESFACVRSEYFIKFIYIFGFASLEQSSALRTTGEQSAICYDPRRSLPLRRPRRHYARFVRCWFYLHLCTQQQQQHCVRTRQTYTADAEHQQSSTGRGQFATCKLSTDRKLDKRSKDRRRKTNGIVGANAAKVCCPRVTVKHFTTDEWLAELLQSSGDHPAVCQSAYPPVGRRSILYSCAVEPTCINYHKLCVCKCVLTYPISRYS
jgi:hypothetical protein